MRPDETAAEEFWRRFDSIPRSEAEKQLLDALTLLRLRIEALEAVVDTEAASLVLPLPDPRPPHLRDAIRRHALRLQIARLSADLAELGGGMGDDAADRAIIAAAASLEPRP